MDKFQNKYRIPSARLQNYDYGTNGAYFITICTANREHYFGEIVRDDQMKLSNVGVIADILWYEIKNHAKNIELDVFQVMPNHLHGILILNGGNGIMGNNGETGNDGTNDNDGIMGIDGAFLVETGHALSLQPTPDPQPQPQPQPAPDQQPQQTIGQQRYQNIGKNTVSSIIGSYKSAVTKHAHRLGFDFAWQTRFHDHIIRNDEEFQRIREYIINNPANWIDDKFYNE